MGVGKYPIKDHSKYHDLNLGKYGFIKWSDELIAIGELIQEYFAIQNILKSKKEAVSKL